jgi:hypothetical protein
VPADLGSANVKHYPSGGATTYEVECVVDAVECEFVSDNAVEGQPAGTIEADQSGNVDLRHRFAAVRSGQHFVEVNGQRVDGDLLVGHADQYAGAVRVGEVVGKLDDRFYPGRVDHILLPPVGDNI